MFLRIWGNDKIFFLIQSIDSNRKNISISGNHSYIGIYKKNYYTYPIRLMVMLRGRIYKFESIRGANA